MTNNTFQSSKKAKSSIKPRKDGQLIVDTATNFAVGIHGATAATIYKYAKETSGEVAAKLSNKVIPGSGAVVEFILDTGVSVGFNEGLELIKDKKFDGIAEDAGVALVSNAAAAAVVGILGMSAAPAILTGLLISSFMGAMYELATSGGSIKDRALGPQAGGNQNTNNSPDTQTQNLDDGSYLVEATSNSQNTSEYGLEGAGGVAFWPTSETTESASTTSTRRNPSRRPTNPTNTPTNPTTNAAQTNTTNASGSNGSNTQQSPSNGSNAQGQNQNTMPGEGESVENGGSKTTTVDNVPMRWRDSNGETEVTGKVTYTRGEKNEDGSYKWKATMEAEVDGKKKVKPHEFNDRDDNNDGLPDNADSDGDGVPNSSDSAPTDSTKQTPNPMHDSGDTSNYDGNHNGLRDFRGDIDYGPDGRPGHGYNGEHDELIGFDPRIDYGPDGKTGVGYNGEQDGLTGINPRIDWDRDRVNNDDFQGNELTERLGKINPRALQEAIESTVFADNKHQAQKMSQTDSLYVVDTQSGIIYHNANGPMKGFGSGGAIAEIEIDQELSLISVDFF